MRSFTTVELARDIKEVTHAATREPVTITHHRRPRFVLMAVEDFERLSKAADPRRVFGPGEAPAEITDLFLPELERLAGFDGPDREA
jgi:prevent-host-death family protein